VKPVGEIVEEGTLQIRARLHHVSTQGSKKQGGVALLSLHGQQCGFVGIEQLNPRAPLRVGAQRVGRDAALQHRQGAASEGGGVVHDRPVLAKINGCAHARMADRVIINGTPLIDHRHVGDGIDPTILELGEEAGPVAADHVHVETAHALHLL
jgi:hypothetical protein